MYDSLGSYTMAWRVGVAVGLAAGIVQVAFALARPTEPPRSTAGDDDPSRLAATAA